MSGYGPQRTGLRRDTQENETKQMQEDGDKQESKTEEKRVGEESPGFTTLG